MQTKRRFATATVTVAAFLFGFLAIAGGAWAHCDTTQGPVVADARIALDGGDITPVLKWLKPDSETEVRAAFQHALEVRALSPEAQHLADRYFFETLVRVHRAGEGAPYTGLRGCRPRGHHPGVGQGARVGLRRRAGPDRHGGRCDGIRDRFARAHAARQQADRSVAQGREYVEAYVELTHYVERLYGTATSTGAHATPEATSSHAEIH